ncbi:hypothetical protein ACF08N_24085 [Streptomyces sp. NPDC015127]|uniref:hypothetical protein n=1 Tax=Streptomyces sp. NPDC015127 TaxID=3364939 RepID=UPI003702FE76
MTFGGQNPYGPTRQPNGGPPPPPPGVPPHPHVPPPYVPPPSPYVPPPYRPPATTLWQRFREDEWPPLREVMSRVPVPGCAWVAILFCVWPVLFLVICYPVARSARRKARSVFPAHSHRRLLDPDVLRVQKIRAWIALAASCAILVAYGTEADWSQAQDQALFRLAVTPWLLLLTAPVVIAVLFRLAPAHARAAMRARVRPAVRLALRYFGAFTAVPVLFAGVMFLSRALPDGVLGTLLTFALLVPVLWVLFFVVFASSTVVRGAFDTAEIHAALPALLTGVLVWELAAINLVTAGMPPGPPLVQICALFGGPASVSAVAWWEIDRLRTRYGVTLRGRGA